MRLSWQVSLAESCCLSPQKETVFGVEKKRGDRAKKRMRSQQESCCGLAFTGLNGLKLIWNSALSLIAREFSHIKHPVVSPPDWN